MSVTDDPSNGGGINPYNVPAAAIVSVFSVAGLVGNTFVIVAVFMSRRLQTTTNIFVVILSIVDFLSALILPYQVAALFGAITPDTGSAIFCEVIGALSYVFIGWSIITLIVIAFNRYFLITQPLQRYRVLFSKRNIVIIVLLALAYPPVNVIIFIAAGWATFGLKNDNLCTLVDGLVFNILSGLSMLILMVAIIFLYVRIYMHVRQHVRKIRNDAPSDLGPSTAEPEASRSGQVEAYKQKQREQKTNTETKISKNLFFVIACFFACMTPITVILFKPDIHSTIEVYCFLILSLNCCLNPAIYAWKHPDFRQVFRCMVACRVRNIEEPSRWLRERMTRDM